jgi:hypothetical protein
MKILISEIEISAVIKNIKGYIILALAEGNFTEIPQIQNIF